MSDAVRISECQFTIGAGTGGDALAREAEVLARLEVTMARWWAWAKARAGELAGDGGAVLRQRMADVLIEQLVATAVLAEAREHRADGETAHDGDGSAEAVALLRHRVRRCLRMAAEAIGESRGETDAALELEWMRRELMVRAGGPWRETGRSTRAVRP
jgi:hypothetical protein